MHITQKLVPTRNSRSFSAQMLCFWKCKLSLLTK